LQTESAHFAVDRGRHGLNCNGCTRSIAWQSVFTGLFQLG
jgi:hypothetical protein